MNRVVYVLRVFPEPSETFVRDEIRALRRLGVPVSIVAGWRSKKPAADWTKEDERGTPVTFSRWNASGLSRSFGLTEARTPRGWLRSLRLASAAAGLARDLPSDTAILHAHFANDASVLARYIARLTGLPYRVTAHAYDIYQDPFLLDRNLRHASQVFTISEANRLYLADRLSGTPGSAPPIEVLRCGIDLEGFPYRDPAPPAAPARLLCVARLVPKKGHAVLFDAIARLRHEGVAVMLTCVGDGPEDRKLRLLAESPGLAGAVTFLGMVPRDEVRRRILRSDAVVLASRVAKDGDRDGIPVALMEAMASGVPVVATAVSGIPELVGTGEGRLVRPDDPAALAEAIRATIAVPQAEREAQTRAARLRIESDFDLRGIAMRLIP